MNKAANPSSDLYAGLEDLDNDPFHPLFRFADEATLMEEEDYVVERVGWGMAAAGFSLGILLGWLVL
jgi:hypothetical protein